MAILYITLILWGYFSLPNTLLHRKGKHNWAKGWDFEIRLLIRVGAMMVGGFLLAGEIYSGMWQELATSRYPTTGQLFLAIFLLIFSGMILRRNFFYKRRKKNIKVCEHKNVVKVWYDAYESYLYCKDCGKYM